MTVTLNPNVRLWVDLQQLMGIMQVKIGGTDRS